MKRRTDLLEWQAEAQGRLDRYMHQREQLGGLIRREQLRLERISELIRLETEEGTSEQLAFSPSFDGKLSNREHASFEAPAEDVESEDEKSGRNFTRRWANFVRDYIDTYGPATVEDLFAKAPSQLRLDFERVPSKYPPLFRARRILRRQSLFAVNRQSGMVTLVTPEAWPIAPEVPQQETDPLMVLSASPDSDGHFNIETFRRSNPQSVVTIPFHSLFGWLNRGNVAWVADERTGVDEPVGAFETPDTLRIVSFNSEGWTDTFDKVTQNL